MRKILDTTLDTTEAAVLAPTAMVQKFAAEMIAHAEGRPILDVACGWGRNAFYIASKGGSVICIDRDLDVLAAQVKRVEDNAFGQVVTRLKLLSLDLVDDKWPFSADSVGGIVNVDFLHPGLLPDFEKSLSPGCCLLLETVGNHGENFRELPRAGAVRSAFETSLDMKVYQERRCGPPGYDAVTVKLFGIKRWGCAGRA